MEIAGSFGDASSEEIACCSTRLKYTFAFAVSIRTNGPTPSDEIIPQTINLANFLTHFGLSLLTATRLTNCLSYDPSKLNIACINSDNDFGQTLSKSLKLKFDIDAKFLDRDLKKIFNLYFDPPATKHDDMYRLCPDTDNAFIDDDDIRQSTLKL